MFVTKLLFPLGNTTGIKLISIWLKEQHPPFWLLFQCPSNFLLLIETKQLSAFQLCNIKYQSQGQWPMEIIQRYNQRAPKISLQLGLLRQRAGVSRGALFSESPQSRHALRGTRHRVSQPRAALKSKTGFKRTAAYLARNLGATTEILRKSVSRLEIRSFQPLGCFKQQELGKPLRKIIH